MTSPAPNKLTAALAECRLHAEILAEDRIEHGKSAYSATSVEALTKEQRRLLDQMAHRFTKLQAALGELALPLLLERAEEPLAEDAPFAQKLQRLERIGIIPSAEQWRELRMVRSRPRSTFRKHKRLGPSIEGERLQPCNGTVGSRIGIAGNGLARGRYRRCQTCP